MIHKHYIDDNGRLDTDLARVSIDWAKRRDTLINIEVNVDIPAIDISLSQLYEPLSSCAVEIAAVRTPGIVGCLMNPTAAWFWFESEPTIPIKALPQGDKLQICRRLIMLNDQGKKRDLKEMIIENGGKIPIIFIPPRVTRSTDFYNSTEMKELRKKSKEKMDAIRLEAFKEEVVKRKADKAIPLNVQTTTTKDSCLTKDPPRWIGPDSPSPAEFGMRDGRQTMWTKLLRTPRQL